jgi:hypothetical protein
VAGVDNTSIGPYATVRRLAESPHGAVYLATGTQGRRVALTVLDERAGKDIRERFAGIVNGAPDGLIGADLTGGRPWAAQPYPPSASVGPLLAQLGGPVREAPGADVPTATSAAETAAETAVAAVEPWAPVVFGRRLTPQLVAVVAAVAVIAMFLIMFSWAVAEYML